MIFSDVVRIIEETETQGITEAMKKSEICCRVTRRYVYDTDNAELEIVYHRMTSDGSNPLVILSGEIKVFQGTSESAFAIASSPDPIHTIEKASTELVDFLALHGLTEQNKWEALDPTVLFYPLADAESQCL